MNLRKFSSLSNFSLKNFHPTMPSSYFYFNHKILAMKQEQQEEDDKEFTWKSKKIIQFVKVLLRKSSIDFILDVELYKV
jgi:hypothetical protein